MDSFEWNKVFAAVISGALLIMVISTVSEGLFPEHHGDTSGFPVEVADISVAAGPVEEGPSLAEMIVSADLDKGASEFGKCQNCHTLNKGGADKIGPNLWGIVGRDIAGSPTFKYSSGLSAQEGAWTFEALDRWLKSPKAMVAGTSMVFNGIKKNDRRAGLIAYLRTLSDNPMPLPEIVDAAQEAVEEAIDDAADVAEGAGGE